ncbi:DUF4435 domain-containing protein [Halomonas sp. LBP4]|uniref:DUF4435 domain-containing protein n=1 Tax=Halomonas sp. LBP4 TaxID=2044917 RepID=UPI000D7664BF|nr:DUF4435 domain-containing protein [Halomonas sp. LBP4]PXX98599.1 hypothetical protein CR157_09975 [Halomonas sp. LBP4]
MSNLIGVLRDSRDAYSEKLRQLLIKHRNNPEALFCIYEGEDAKYYGVRIDVYCRFEKRIQVPCKGKDDVLRLFERVAKDETLNKAYTAFFVDHDYDGVSERHKNENLYVTPCYSIENFYVTEEAFRNIIVDEFGVSEFQEDQEADILVDNYSRCVRELVSEVKQLNAWLALQVERGSKLNVNNVKLTEFVDVGLHGVERKYSLESLLVTFPEAKEVSLEEVKEKERELERFGLMNSSRGKFLLEFLRLYMMEMKSDLVRKEPQFFPRTRKIKFNLTRYNVLSELSQYAVTPNCLKEFLGKIA